jgi:hypothetical protein
MDFDEEARRWKQPFLFWTGLSFCSRALSSNNLYIV